MTRATLRTLQTGFMSVDLDNFYGESPSTANQNEQLNWAYRRIARKCHLVHPMVTFTPVAGQSIYSLTGSSFGGRRMVEIYNLTINGTMLRECSGVGFGLWTYREFVQRYPQWQTADNGTPTKACVYGQNMILHAPPTSAVVTAAECYAAGQYIPADMDDDADEPDLPEEIHPAIAYLAAIYAANPVATEPEMWKRLEVFGEGWISMVDDISEQNRNSMINPGSMAGDAFSDVLRI